MTMSGEALLVSALVILAALTLGYVLIQIDKSKPALARRLQVLLVLLQVVLVLAKFTVKCNTNEERRVRQPNYVATLDAMHPTMDALRPTADALRPTLDVLRPTMTALATMGALPPYWWLTPTATPTPTGTPTPTIQGDQ